MTGITCNTMVTGMNLKNTVEELHIKYEVNFVRHREWTDTEYIQRLVDTFNRLPEIVRVKIHTLRDHKGVLMVTWKEKPSPLEIACVELSWKVNNEEGFEHYFVTEVQGNE